MTRVPHVKQPQGNKGRRPGAARQTQWQFQADLLDQLGDAVIAVDQDERITYLNRAAVAQYGVDPTSVIGQPLHQLYCNKWLQPEDELLADIALAQQGHWRGENRHLRQDGSTLHVESLVTVLHDAAGNRVGLLATIRDITDRKQIERDLRASELRYRRLADTMPQLIWTADASGRTDYYNIHIHDFDPSVWQGTNGFDWASLLHPADLAPTLAAWQQAVIHRQPYTCEHRMHMADGSWRWHLSRAALLQDPDQGFKWYGTATDIHERKLAEATLRTSEERYRTLFETMDEGFCVFEMLYNEVGAPVDYRFLEVNPAFTHFTGLENAVGKTAYELVSNLEPHWVAIYGEVARTGEAHHFIEGSAAMGRWFEVHAFRFGGPESRRVALLFNNITERKLIEDALRDSEEDLRYTVELNPQAPWTADPAGNITSFNQRWLDLTGMREEEALGSGWMQTPHPADRPAIVAAWSHAIQSGEPYDIEHRIRLADGSYRWMRSRAFPRRDAKGAIVRWYGATEDIHERKQMEEALHASEARFRSVQQASPDGYMIFENVRNEQGVITDFRWLYINPAGEQMIGRRAQDLLGKRLLEEMPGNREEGLFDAYVQVVETGEVYQREFCYQHEGIDRWFRNTAAKAGDGFAVAFSDITARKQAEIALQQSNAILQGVLECSNDAIFVRDLTGRYLLVNEAGAAQVRLPKNAILGRRYQDLFTAAEVAAIQEDDRSVLEQGRAVTLEHVVTQQGDLRYWHTLKMPLRDATGAIVGLISSARDLTERKAAEEALRASEERLRLALAGGGMGIWESQIATNRSLWSPEEYALFGLPMGVEITSELFNRLVHPADLPGLQVAMQRLFSSGKEHIGEFRIIRPDGAVRWLADRVTLLRDEAGEPVRLLGINFDITERKAREAMIRQQLAEIEAIYATAPIGLCLVDCDLRYVRINETLATINGGTIAGYLGRTLAETMSVEGYRLVEPLYRQVIETGLPLLHQEVDESHIDPVQARDWLANYYPLKNAKGVVIGVNAVILEITERKRHERQLQELNRQLQESNATLEERVSERTKALEGANRALSTINRELEQFTYAAAHDLRTPLRGIANLVQWISEDAAPVIPPASQRHLGQLSGRVKRLEKMLEDLLLYSRVGRVRYQPEEVEVQQLLCGLIDLLAPPVGFVIKLSPQLPTFTTLRIPLEMVFRNLLSNAMRHHHEPARGQVEIMVRDQGEWYEFRVSDNGPGIAPQYHERIFGMFQTLKPRDQVEGSGIGLALVKKTLENIGGHIWMESVIGQGTTFYFTWPKEQKAEERREKERRAERGSGARGEGERRV